MAYVKTTWQTGDVITAAKLNNMEGGIEAAQAYILEPSVEGSVATLPLTVAELFAAVKTHIVGLYQENNEIPRIYYFAYAIYDSRDGYMINFTSPNPTESLGITFTATDLSDYPSVS